MVQEQPMCRFLAQNRCLKRGSSSATVAAAAPNHPIQQDRRSSLPRADQQVREESDGGRGTAGGLPASLCRCAHAGHLRIQSMSEIPLP